MWNNGVLALHPPAKGERSHCCFETNQKTRKKKKTKECWIYFRHFDIDFFFIIIVPFERRRKTQDVAYWLVTICFGHFLLKTKIKYSGQRKFLFATWWMSTYVLHLEWKTGLLISVANAKELSVTNNLRWKSKIRTGSLNNVDQFIPFCLTVTIQLIITLPTFPHPSVLVVSPCPFIRLWMGPICPSRGTWKESVIPFVRSSARSSKMDQPPLNQKPEFLHLGCPRTTFIWHCCKKGIRPEDVCSGSRGWWTVCLFSAWWSSGSYKGECCTQWRWTLMNSTFF